MLPTTEPANEKYAEFTPVRTPQRPMAFTRREFWRGVRATWVSAMILLVIFLTISALLSWTPSWGSLLGQVFMVLMYGVPVGAIVTAIVALAASPLAWALGRQLARTARIAVHVASFAALGALVGMLVYVAYLAIMNVRVVPEFASPTLWVLSAGCSLAVCSGWSWTVRKSIREQEPATS